MMKARFSTLVLLGTVGCHVDDRDSMTVGEDAVDTSSEGGGLGNGETDSGGSTDDGSGDEQGDYKFDVGAGEDGGSDSDDCQPQLSAQVRDFTAEHPDFETFTGDGAYTGLVQALLGPDGKPVYAPNGGTAQTTGGENFDQWYRDVPGTNMTFSIDLSLSEFEPDVFSFDSSAFFPLDGIGWGNQGNNHNFHFTTEIHTTFEYSGGEVFHFRGDDDVWVFVNERLALDLGGVHEAVEGSIDFDAMASELGIEPGGEYSLDVFHAERHTVESNFRIDTTIPCFRPPPP